MYQWEFEGERNEMSLAVINFSVDGKSQILEGMPGGMRHLMPAIPTPDLPDFSHDSSIPARLSRLSYLTAERLGPREIYPLEDPQLTPVVGPTGEHAASVLYSGRDNHVADTLTIEGVPPTRSRQVEARMGELFPGFEMTMDKVPYANSVRLGIRTSKDSDFHRPGHTGFGITQVLPIVVAALSADHEDLIVIENPEVHLHPVGQAKMGEFLSDIAASGVQVILETHSDHVLNGIRRAVKNSELSPDDTALHFFRPRQDAERDGTAQVQSPHLDSEGNIDDWPEGFFDQFDRDMSYFAGWC